MHFTGFGQHNTIKLLSLTVHNQQHLAQAMQKYVWDETVNKTLSILFIFQKRKSGSACIFFNKPHPKFHPPALSSTAKTKMAQAVVLANDSPHHHAFPNECYVVLQRLELRSTHKGFPHFWRQLVPVGGGPASRCGNNTCHPSRGEKAITHIFHFGVAHMHTNLTRAQLQFMLQPSRMLDFCSEL